MKTLNQYFVEYLFLAVVFLLSVAGFWAIYFGANANPNAHHHLHVITNFCWLFLLLYQLQLVSTNNFRQHRKAGLLVLFLGPWLFASTALLSVYSAHKGVVSGEGDFLIVQNVGVTVELGLLLFLAFALRKRRKVHGSLMLSTSLLFMGIALFFTLISFVPQFKIEGPETFYRFQTASITGQGICLLVGFLFLARDFRNGWPMLLAAAFFPLNELIRSFLDGRKFLQPLTEFVGGLSQPFTFVGSFALMLALLAATGVQNGRQKVER